MFIIFYFGFQHNLLWHLKTQRQLTILDYQLLQKLSARSNQKIPLTAPNQAEISKYIFNRGHILYRILVLFSIFITCEYLSCLKWKYSLRQCGFICIGAWKLSRVPSCFPNTRKIIDYWPMRAPSIGVELDRFPGFSWQQNKMFSSARFYLETSTTRRNIIKSSVSHPLDLLPYDG